MNTVLGTCEKNQNTKHLQYWNPKVKEKECRSKNTPRSNHWNFLNLVKNLNLQIHEDEWNPYREKSKDIHGSLRHADDTTLMARSEEELESFLMKGKAESEKAVWKLNIQKTKIMASAPITSWKIDGETMQTVRDYFLGLQNHCRWWLQPWN